MASPLRQPQRPSRKPPGSGGRLPSTGRPLALSSREPQHFQPELAGVSVPHLPTSGRGQECIGNTKIRKSHWIQELAMDLTNPPTHPAVFSHVESGDGLWI